MKKYYIMSIALAILYIGCSIGKPNVVLQGDIERGYTEFGSILFQGQVINIGDKVASGVKVDLLIYVNESKSELLETRRAILVKDNMKPGEVVRFKAVASIVRTQEMAGWIEADISWDGN